MMTSAQAGEWYQSELEEIIKEKKWQKRFMDLTSTIATWSKDPSTQVGALIVQPYKNRIVSMGFNGFPRNIADLAARLEDRETKYRYTIHAEMNAILHAREPLDGMDLYVSPLHPCVGCACAIIQTGIRRVFYRQPKDVERWRENFLTANAVLREAGIQVMELT